MPYVSSRVKDELAQGRPPLTVGELTYALQQTIQRYLLAKGTIHFHDLSECLGALEAAKIDFTDRVLLPYEHGKRAENGDAWGDDILVRLPR